MSRLRVQTFSISIDGYGAGPCQDLQNPLGVGGPELFDWFFHTRTWQRMQGNEAGETSVDDEIAAQGLGDGCGGRPRHPTGWRRIHDSAVPARGTH